MGSNFYVLGSGDDDVAQPQTSTPEGCRCSSLCGPSVSDHFTRDWCYTRDSCGSWFLGHGYWDYCQYLNSQRQNYTSMSWREKQDALWQMIAADDTPGQYYANDLLTESVLTSFDDEWDVMPNGRHKVIHSVGAICPFQLEVSTDSPYTGLLKVFDHSTLKWYLVTS